VVGRTGGGRTGENFGVEKRWKKKKKIGQGGWDFRPSRKRPQRAHPQLVHWWVLIHSSRYFQGHKGLPMDSLNLTNEPHLIFSVQGHILHGGGDAQYVTLDNKIKCLSLACFFGATLSMKL